MAKSGMSVGCIVATLIGVFFLIAAVALVGVVGVGYYYSRRSAPASSPPLSRGTEAPAATPAASPAEAPEPTPEQAHALDGGKTVEWKENGVSWTVPANWNKQQEVAEAFSVKSPGSFDAAWLSAQISPPMPDSFPADASINAMYQQALDQKKSGKYTEVRWLALDGVRGVEFAEAAPGDPTDVRRIEWQGYVVRDGQTRLLTMLAHSSGKGFPEHEDTLYAILYSTKVSK